MTPVCLPTIMSALSGTNFSQAVTQPSPQMLTACVTNHQAHPGDATPHERYLHTRPFPFILQGEKLNQWHLSYAAFALQFNWLGVTKCLGQASDVGATSVRKQIRRIRSHRVKESDAASPAGAKDSGQYIWNLHVKANQSCAWWYNSHQNLGKYPPLLRSDGRFTSVDHADWLLSYCGDCQVTRSLRGKFLSNSKCVGVNRRLSIEIASSQMPWELSVAGVIKRSVFSLIWKVHVWDENCELVSSRALFVIRHQDNDATHVKLQKPGNQGLNNYARPKYFTTTRWLCCQTVTRAGAATVH